MWEELFEFIWLLTPVLIISFGSYMLYKHPETYLDYVSVDSGDSQVGNVGGGDGSDHQDLGVFDIIDLTSDDDEDEDYTGSISSSSSNSGSDSDSSSDSGSNELYKKGFDVEIFEEPYVDEHGNNRTKYTFVQGE